MSESQAAGGATNQPGGQAEDPAKAGQQGDPNAKPAEGQGGAADPNAKPEGGAKDEGGKATEGDFKFELPEGVALDEARLAEFSTIAKDLGLTNEAAQKLVTWEAKRLSQQADAHLASVKAWHEELQADKDVGGDKLDANTATARKAIDLGPPELKKFLNDTGLGNHPLLFKWALSVGKKLSEDTLENGGKPAGAAKAFYEASPELKP